MMKPKRKNERGIALLLAIVALLLISAAGIALLFSSDTETAIGVNYRDKQVAIYGALAGLQEARERINPATGDLAALAPTGLPSTAAKNVLYIINPATDPVTGIKETVAPWATTVTINGHSVPNPYFDTELCQESLTALGLSGTPGVPCNPSDSSQVPPSGNAWYAVYDNSDNATSWQLKNTGGQKAPLSYKWVRVTLKADNMTPAKVGSGVGKQVCWNLNHQEQLKTGYSNCMESSGGAVNNIAIIDPGSGYTTAPNVTISAPGGTGTTAQATATLVNLPAGVTSVSLGDHGTGYTTTPNVTISGGGGSGATATATLGGGVPISSVTLDVAGTPPCYPLASQTSPPLATFSNANGSGAKGTVQMTGARCIYGFSSSGSCTKNTTYNITASNGSGSGFAGTVAYGGNKNSGTAVIVNPGNYTVVPTTFNTGSCAITITPQYGVQIQQVNIDAAGSYTAAPAVTFSGGTAAGSGTITGTGVLNGTPTPGTLIGLTLTNPGLGYTSAPSVTIDPPGGTGTPATATASIAPSKGVQIDLVDGGSGYTSNPTITLDPPPPAPGTPATANATVGGGSSGSVGRVYLITSMAQTSTGARAMAQMEVGETYKTTKSYTLQLGGAITLAGPSPGFGTPNSNPFKMIGTDANSCGETVAAAKPAIGVWDDPNNPTSPTAVDKVLDSLGKPKNYLGLGAAPDVENVFNSLGSPDADSFDQFVASVTSVASNVYGSNPPSINLGTAANPAINVVNGDFSMGPSTGYGVLVVTGTLSFSGNYSWNGLILVIGKGASIMNGGGNGQITGAVFVANTTGGTLNSPTANWSGGGGNGIQYDHCWADNMLKKIPTTTKTSLSAFDVISLRMLDM